MRRSLSAMLVSMIAFSLASPAVVCGNSAQGAERSAQSDGEQARELEDNSRPYAPPSASKSVEIANYYLKRKKYNAALSRYQEAVRTDPYYASGYLGLGKVYEKIGLRQKALVAYKKYLDLLPSEKEADEAKGVHQAIARLERELKVTSPFPPSRTSAADAPRRR